ncbi:GNAT family N-acetyltransferase [Streptomyces lincolnensis]|uniref:GNAT family N-acetyltransferase n=1 Tax=Streptomyces lincolnensis TaxID=1915 RepID=UPI001E4D46CF|nr:GNAT family N-acetyltransferase [Streptomyces lincolnensis]
MSAPEPSADAGTASITGIGPDTAGTPGCGTDSTDTGPRTGRLADDGLGVRVPDQRRALFQKEGSSTAGARSRPEGTTPPTPLKPPADDMIGGVAAWGPIATPVGMFRLVPVGIERDLRLVNRWMNDPAVAEFWELAGPQNITEEHLRAQLAGDGSSVPCLGVLDGTPMSYWEIYRADLDPLARDYAARPDDIGIHILIGGAADRGRGLGSALLRAVADLVLVKRSSCARVVAEPDLRNIPSIAAFLSAGFRFSAEAHLPAKRAALMVRDRCLSHLL